MKACVTLMMSVWMVQAMATPEPKFEILAQTADYEIRRYPAMLVAETSIDGNYRNAGDSAFQLLFGYISGRNQQAQKIDADQRLIERPKQKIEMTAPVFSSVMEGGEAQPYVYQFVMPERFTLATLPIPSDERVQLREVAAQVVAVRRFKGCPDTSDVAREQAKLLAALEVSAIRSEGEAMLARYNAPYVPCIMRRNEVMVQLPDYGT